MIKAIETCYKGYRFRSRLEARWAVYFDAVGLKWEYEAEGFDVGWVVGWYLPDFWFPELNIYAEVKPVEFSDYDRLKCSLLQSHTGSPVIMLDGIPTPKLYWDAERNAYGLFPYKEYIWASTRLECHYSYMPFLAWPVEIQEAEEADIAAQNCLVSACAAARSARFEHGETPR